MIFGHMANTESIPVPQDSQGLLRLAQIFLVLAIAALFLLSNLMLATLGLNYEGAGGAAWQKIHPASYLAILGLAIMVLRSGNPLRFVDELIARQPGVLILTVGVGALLVFISLFIKGPVTQLIDTFVLPICLFVMLTRQSEPWLQRAALFVHAFMACNALLGLAEFLVGFRITPIIAEGIELTGDWRSSALLGHPLSNAALTALYAFMLVAGGGRDLPRPVVWGALLLQVLAMAAFGGRTATGLFFLFAVPALCLAVWRFRGRFEVSPGSAAGLVALALVALMAGVALVEAGFFDRFLMRFLEDQGSAAARQSMFYLLDRLPPENFLFGSDPELIATLQRLEGIPFGIESFWIAFVANYGLVMSALFFLTLFAFLRELNRVSAPASLYAIVMFILICSTSTSLASKTASLAVFVTLTAILLRKPPPLSEHG